MPQEKYKQIFNEFKLNNKRKFIRNKSLFAIMVAIFVSFGLLSTYLLSDYLKKVAVNNLSQSNAEQSSEFVFETMYAKMQDGWNKDEINRLLARMNQLSNGMKVKVYRSRIVDELYGAIPADKKAVTNDPIIQKAMNGEVQFLPNDDGSGVRYVYPITVQQDCLKCHPNAKVGDVNGVIDMYLPASNIQIPLENIMKYFLIFTAIAIVITFAIFHYLTNKVFIAPIEKFTDAIDSVSVNEIFNDYVHCYPKTYEVDVLETTFNRLLAKINQMLVEIRNKNKLLEEYKKAIDSSTIVTKTNKKGIITYVNQQFCSISGYKEEELVGRNHNIVRSPNMPKSAFKELWETIQNKQAWQGVVENCKKNGESYFVKATIMPILDEHDKIVEYIAIRQDITDLTRHQLEEVEESISSALEINIEKTIGLISIATVCVNSLNDIVFANENFCKLFDKYDVVDLNIDDMLIEENGYIYKDNILDWKDSVISLQDDILQKALIEVGGEQKEFVIMATKLDQNDWYLLFFIPFTFCNYIKIA